MGMSIDKAIEHGKEQLEIFGGEHKEFIETSIDTMRKYQKIKEIIQHWIDEDLASESPSFADSGTIEDIIEVIEDGSGACEFHRNI